MNCPVCEGKQAETVIGYAAGTLPVAERAAFERHMAVCAECRTVAEAQQAAWGALDDWRAPAVSEDFDQKLCSRIDAEERLPWWKRRWRTPGPWLSWKPAIPVAIACAALCGAFLLRNVADNPVPPGSAPPAVVRALQDTRKVDINQVESALDDLDMLNQLGGEKPSTAGAQTGS